MAGKKENNSGSILFVEGRAKPWRVQYSLRGQRKSGGYYATQAEAAKALRKITSEIDSGSFIEPSKITVSAWLDTWLDEYCISLKSSTLVQYKAYVKNHLKPALGKIKLCELRADRVQHMINNLQRSQHGSKPLASKTIKNIVTCLRAALEQAMKNGLLHNNPCKAATLPKADNETQKDIHPFSNEEVALFTKAIAGHHFENIFLLALQTGMRLSEILGLQWTKIDLKTGRIRIDQQMTMKRTKDAPRQLTATKTRNAREFILPPVTLDILKRQRAEQAKARLYAGEVWTNENNLVFTDELGKERPHASVEHAFTKLLEQAGIKKHRFHDLRHTAAVNMLAGGLDLKSVSTILGHSDIGTTANVYLVFTETLQKQAAEKLQAWLTREA